MAISLLSDWAQILSLLVAILAILVSFWMYRYTLQKRSLTCWIDPIIFPVEIRGDDKFDGELKIVYRGHRVENLFVVRARIKNTGNLPIRGEDVVEPLSFSFAPGADLLHTPEIINKKPENLEIDCTVIKADAESKRKSVILHFDLLNPDEEFTVEFLCTGTAKTPDILARIEGIKELVLVDPKETYSSEKASVTMTDILGIAIVTINIVLVSLMLIFLISKISSSNMDVIPKWIIGGFFVLFCLFIMASLMMAFPYLLHYQNGKRKKGNQGK